MSWGLGNFLVCFFDNFLPSTLSALSGIPVSRMLHFWIDLQIISFTIFQLFFCSIFQEFKKNLYLWAFLQSVLFSLSCYKMSGTLPCSFLTAPCLCLALDTVSPLLSVGAIEVFFYFLHYLCLLTSFPQFVFFGLWPLCWKLSSNVWCPSLFFIFKNRDYTAAPPR